MSFFQGSRKANVVSGTLVGVHGSGNNVSVVADDKRKGEGIELLLKSIHPEAMHDLGACEDLGCHPGTREEYIQNITDWGKGEWDSNSEKCAFLMTGLAGAGKLAIAQTCADNFEVSGKLGTSFFFFRPSGWNDPKKFIPTIAYQLTTRYSAYRNCIDAIILDDCLVLRKAMDVQFQELLIKPLQKLSNDGHSVGKDVVIIVDGLDECSTVDAQIQIIKLITTSIHAQTTPFLWVFFSRPEPPITSAFLSDLIENLSWKLPLTLSHDANSDIEAYIHASFEMICAQHNIPTNVAWPKEDDITCLVSQSAALFVYPVTAMRYIGKGPSGLEERLRAVLQLDPTSASNPFSALDQLYMLVMMQILEGVLVDTLSLLYLNQACNRGLFALSDIEPNTHQWCKVLNLTPAAFYTAISNLYSILEVTKSENGMPQRLDFYHNSIIDFLFDEVRSKQYFVPSPDVQRLCLKRLICTMLNMSATNPNSQDCNDISNFMIPVFFGVVHDLDGKVEEDVLQQVSELDWTCWRNREARYITGVRDFIQKIPTRWRRKIIRPSRKGLSDIPRQILAIFNPGVFEARAYIMGTGKKKALMVRDRQHPWIYRIGDTPSNEPPYDL